MTQDLPFYSAQPTPINGRGWLLILGTTLLAVAVLMLIPSRPIPFAFLAAVLFTGLVSASAQRAIRLSSACSIARANLSRSNGFETSHLQIAGAVCK